MGYFRGDRIYVSQPLGEVEDWTLEDDLVFVASNNGYGIAAPKGFVTDFASIPWAFRRLFPKSGKWNAAAIIHDYLYRCTTIPRVTCDRIFKEALEAVGVSPGVVATFYAGVRVGGGITRTTDAKAPTCRGGHATPLPARK